jgi:threonine aldolase
MRQSGLLAAGALWALDHLVERIPEDHANARELAVRLAELPGISLDLAATQTNIVVFDVAASGRTPVELAGELAERGVLVVPFAATLLRAVTHLDVSRHDVIRAAEVLEDLLAGTPAEGRA